MCNLNAVYYALSRNFPVLRADESQFLGALIWNQSVIVFGANNLFIFLAILLSKPPLNIGCQVSRYIIRIGSPNNDSQLFEVWKLDDALDFAVALNNIGFNSPKLIHNSSFRKRGFEKFFYRPGA